MFIVFSTRFGELCAHPQEKIPYLCDTCYQSLYIDDWYAGPCIPDSHLYRVTNNRCHIGTVFSPDDGHIVARNVQSKSINILRKFVHQVGSFEILCKDARSTKHKIYLKMSCRIYEVMQSVVRACIHACILACVVSLLEIHNECSFARRLLHSMKQAKPGLLQLAPRISRKF